MGQVHPLDGEVHGPDTGNVAIMLKCESISRLQSRIVSVPVT